jgi:hypothetical protein
MPAIDNVSPGRGASRSTTASPSCSHSQEPMHAHSPVGHDHRLERRHALTASWNPSASRTTFDAHLQPGSDALDLEGYHR